MNLRWIQNKKVIETKAPLFNLIHEETVNGKKKWFSVEKLPYFDNEGKVAGVLGFAFEITELKEKEAELTEAKNRAEQADNLKTEFLAQISHEVRSPINTILNYVSLIKEITQEVKDEDLVYGFNAIDSSSRRLIRTIDLILNMSQLQTGKLDLNIKNVDIECDILKPIIKELRNSAESKGLTFVYSPSVKGRKVKADQYSVTQIFVNLIENAIKYTKSGSIKISDSIQNGKLEISVSDTGIGIAREFLPYLFDPFRQEEQGYTRKYEGNGLGLALVKKYCEHNNAQIKVESEKGIGSTFTVTFNL